MSKTNIPLVDLNAQYSTIKKEVDIAIKEVLESTRFVGGEQVSLFEKEFANFIGTKYCVTFNSGTDSLILGIRGLDLEKGDEVILPTNTFNATAAGISENGLKPLFVDIDENDYGINLDDLEEKITPETKAIVVVHLYGQADKIDEVKKIIKETGRKIYLIEDSCQSHGAKYKGKNVGSFGIFSAFSFYPGKNLGAYGDGGAITTNNKKLADNCRVIKNHGQKRKYVHITHGVNSNLDAIQAAILRVKLKHIDKWNKKRREKAKLYTKLINDKLPFLKTPNNPDEKQSVYHLYVVRAPKRNLLLKYLNKKGVQAGIHYPTPIHLQKAYKYLGYKKGDLPISEKLAKEIISLPIYPELKNKDIEYIVETIESFYEKN